MEQLNSIFFYQLERAIKTYRQYAQINIIKSGFAITIDQWLVLRSITDSPEITQTELAKVVFKDKASVTRIIDLLVKNKYLKRSSHAESGRRVQLTTTEKGKRIVKDIMPTVLKNRNSALKNIHDKDLLITERVLNAITRNCSN